MCADLDPAFITRNTNYKKKEEREDAVCTDFWASILAPVCFLAINSWCRKTNSTCSITYVHIPCIDCTQQTARGPVVGVRRPMLNDLLSFWGESCAPVFFPSLIRNERSLFLGIWTWLRVCVGPFSLNEERREKHSHVPPPFACSSCAHGSSIILSSHDRTLKLSWRETEKEFISLPQLLRCMNVVSLSFCTDT